VALDLTGISNVNEFYSHHYLDALLESDLKGVLSRWDEAEGNDNRTPPYKLLSRCAEDYYKAKARVAATVTLDDRFTETHAINVKLAEALGYPYQANEYELIENDRAVPVLASLARDGNPYIWLVEAPFADEDHEPLKQRITGPQMQSAFAARGEGYSFALENWENLLSLIFRREQPPRWVILLAGSMIFLAERHKWGQGKYLLFNVDEILGRKQESALKATAALLARDCLAPDDGVVLHDSLDENSHKHAFAVSGDLKYGLRRAVELLANEYVWYQRNVAKQALFGDDSLARKLTVESLTSSISATLTARTCAVTWASNAVATTLRMPRVAFPPRFQATPLPRQRVLRHGASGTSPQLPGQLPRGRDWTGTRESRETPLARQPDPVCGGRSDRDARERPGSRAAEREPAFPRSRHSAPQRRSPRRVGGADRAPPAGGPDRGRAPASGSA
jgi:hypothetical protein